MNFFWYHDKIIQQYLRVKFKNSNKTEHEFGNSSYQKLHLINCCFSSRPWGMLHDITNHVQHPFNIITKNPYQYKQQNKNFGEVCIETAIKIANITDRPLAVAWSGGIDSTAALVALMQTVELNRITVVCNKTSIEEFPSFYENKIKNRVNVISLTELSDRYADYFTVSGDGGDTVWAVLDESFWKNNQQKIRLPWQDCIDQTIINDIDFIENFCSWSGVEIKSWVDLRTWFYLCCKWQDKCMRPYYLRQDVTDKDTVGFYDIDTSFQNWTINNLDKIIGNTWQDYKIPAKEFIYQYHQDSDYLQNKSKENSISIEQDLNSTYQTYMRIAVSAQFLGPRLPSWPFIDYAEIEDFNDRDGLIPRYII